MGMIVGQGAQGVEDTLKGNARGAEEVTVGVQGHLGGK